MKKIIKNGQGEYIEKKSKFIANLFYIKNIEEAEKIIYQHINPVYACDLGIGELEPGKNYESIYIPVQCFR